MNLLQKYILLIFSIAFPFTGFAQNLLSKDGLKYGYWSDSTTGERKGNEDGIYKIISKTKYKLDKTVDKGRGGITSTTYINGYAILFFDNASDDSISVKDGSWKRYDSAGKLVAETDHHEGIWLEWKLYDTAGKLNDHGFNDYSKNCSYWHIYENERLFKTVFYPSLGAGMSQSTYYPNDNLDINDAQSYMTCRFGTKPADTIGLRLTARKKATTIKSIIIPSENLKILDSVF
ncbi:MAG: hypothetical protein V4685_05865, partial [Bacteroidota bacterium]